MKNNILKVINKVHKIILSFKIYFEIFGRIILDVDVTNENFVKELSVLSQKINFVREQSSEGNVFVN